MNILITIISYIAMLCSIIGNIFVNRKMVIGMYIWSIGSLLWMVFAIYNRTWSQLIMFTIYTVLNIEGIIKWRKWKHERN